MATVKAIRRTGFAYFLKHLRGHYYDYEIFSTGILFNAIIIALMALGIILFPNKKVDKPSLTANNFAIYLIGNSISIAIIILMVKRLKESINKIKIKDN